MNSHNTTYRSIALALALLVLFASRSIVVDIHFKKENLKPDNFFGKKKPCKEMTCIKQIKKCSHYKLLIERNQECPLTQKERQENKKPSVPINGERHLQTLDFTLIEQFDHFVTAYIADCYCDFINYKESGLYSGNYKQPVISKDFTILKQSFLI